jgi:hypothetical protein
LSKTTIERVRELLREVAVIVVGVSLALGADALYGIRQDRVELDRILGSIDADLRLDSLDYDRAVGRQLDLARDATSRLLALIEDPSADAANLEVARLIRASVVTPSGNKESATYREITATGRIGLIRDPKLRTALLRYYSRSFTALPPEMLAAYRADISGEYERSLRRHMGSAYVALMACTMGRPDYESCLRGPSERIDLARLRSDQEFVEQLVGMTLWAGRFKNFVEQQSREHLALASQLRAAMGDS